VSEPRAAALLLALAAGSLVLLHRRLTIPCNAAGSVQPAASAKHPGDPGLEHGTRSAQPCRPFCLKRNAARAVKKLLYIF